MRTVLATLAGLALASPALAAPPIRNGGNLGVGIGGSTLFVGFDTKYWINPWVTFQAVIGLYDLSRGFDTDTLPLGTNADFLVEIPFVAAEDSFDFGMNIGAGGVFATTIDGEFDLVAGANVVVGLVGNIDAVPLDVVIDYRPTVFFVDDLDGLGGDAVRLDFVHFGAHVRYWF